MAVSFTGSGTAATTSSSSYVTSRTLSAYTVGAGSDRCLYAVLNLTDSGSATPALTWDGVSMTLVSTLTIGLSRLRVYRLVNPATGTQTLSASWSGSYPARLVAVSLAGVDQTTPDATPVTATGTGTAVSTGAVTTSADDATLGFACVSDPGAGTASFTTPETQTGIYRETAVTELATAVTYALGGTSNSHDFTSGGSDTWGAIGMRVFAAAGGGGSNRRRRFFMAA